MINHITIVGRLTKDPILQTTVNGRKTAFINVATSAYSDYLKKVVTNFVSVKLWGRTAEYATSKAKKGMEVTVEGSLRTSSYVNEQDKQIFVTEVMVEKFHVLQGRIEIDEENDTSKAMDNLSEFVKALQ
ncbi:single-stranded DNA-binding protein [Bacillus sp. RG28]|uniref:Single-stranded DNA-binding protein n=1 Tax=Gottfriedia endophytica TaxID=2820819 RepID=A0A940NKZ3_9BACI|nr:single-stranded DNA-binding protein [Gottfriedia endophytica]MBP0724094.1 single-stranded DNA-binding protein [Gottfriedia endophytica]